MVGQDYLDTALEAWDAKQSGDIGKLAVLSEPDPIERAVKQWELKQPLGAIDVWHEAMDRPLSNVPYVRYGEAGGHFLSIKRAFEAEAEGKATPEQKQRIWDYVEKEVRPKSAGYYGAAILHESLPAIAEYATSGGVANAVLGSGEKLAIRELMALTFAQAAKKAALGVGKAAIQLGVMEAGGQLAGGLGSIVSDKLVNAGPVTRTMYQMWLPDHQLTETEAGDLNVVFDATAKDFYDALPAALTQELIETVSERSGEAAMAAIGKSGGKFAELPGIDRLKLQQSWLARWWLGKHTDETVATLSEKIAEKLGWDTIVGEWLEERAADIAHFSTPTDPAFGDTEQLMPGLDQMAGEAIGFLALGTAGKALGEGINRLAGGKEQTPAAPGTPEAVPPRETPLPPLPPMEQGGTVEQPPVATAQAEPTPEAKPGSEPMGGSASTTPLLGPAPATQLLGPAPTVPELDPAPTATEEPASTPPQPQPLGQPGSTATPLPNTETKAGAVPTDATGIKNAEVLRRLDEMGLPPPPDNDPYTLEGLAEGGIEKLGSDRGIGERLIKELTENPRAPTKEENSILVMESARLIEERDAAQEAFIADPTEANKARVQDIREKYARAADLWKKVGGLSSASLNTRRMMVNADYTLAGMEQRLRVAKDGAELSEKEDKFISDLHRRMKSAEEKLDTYVAELEARTATAEAEAALLRASKEATRGVRKATRAKAIEKSKKRIDELLHELNVQGKAARSFGFSAEQLATMVKLAVEHIKLGYTTAAQFADTIVGKLGEEMRPYAEEAWKIATTPSGSPALKGYKTRKLNKARELGRRIREGDFSKPARRKVQLDDIAVKLKADVEELQHEFDQAEERARMANRTLSERLADYSLDTLELITRGIAAGIDLASLGYQAGPVLFSEYLFHPTKAAGIVRSTLRALTSERAERELNIKRHNDPLYDFWQTAGLRLTGPGAHNTKQEEAIRSKLSERLPILKNFNSAFRASINEARYTLASMMAYGLGRIPTMEEGKEIARIVNMATGHAYGKGDLQAGLHALGRFFWAPNLVLSRFQMAAEPIRQTARLALGNVSTDVAKQQAKFVGRYIVGLAGIYAALGFAALAYNKDDDDYPIIEWDWRSSDFMQVRFGNRRVDPTSGLRSALVFIGRTVTLETKSTKTGRVSSLYKPPYGKRSWSDVLWTFMRSKLAPTVAIPIDVLTGTNVVGEATTLQSAPLRAITPMSVRDIYDSIKEDVNDPVGYLLGFLGATLFRVSTYE